MQDGDVPSLTSSGTSGLTYFTSNSVEDTVETCNSGETAMAFISVFKAPTRYALCRQRRVAINHIPKANDAS